MSALYPDTSIARLGFQHLLCPIILSLWILCEDKFFILNQKFDCDVFSDFSQCLILADTINPVFLLKRQENNSVSLAVLSHKFFFQSDSTFLVLVEFISLKLFLFEVSIFCLVFRDSEWWIICLESC